MGMMMAAGARSMTFFISVWSQAGTRYEKLKQPVTLDGYRIRPPQVSLVKADLQKAEILVTIHEGRNRQVRRMCDLAGMQVQRLIRISEGPLQLGRLPLGKWRYLTDEEVNLLSK